MSVDTGLPSLDRALEDIDPRRFWPGAYARFRIQGWWWNLVWRLEQRRERRRARLLAAYMADLEDESDGSDSDTAEQQAVRTAADAQELLLRRVRRNRDRANYRRWL